MSTGNRMNMVTIDQAAALMTASITDAFQKGMVPDPSCLHGSPGVGKSAIIMQMAENLETKLGKPVEVIDIRLSAMEASDVQGIPYVADTGRTIVEYRNGEEAQREEKEMFFSTPAWWPRDPNKFYILFLDELKNAPPHVQHAAYRLILDRSVQNGTRLPDTCAIIAAGNLKSDKTGARELLPAAANRFAMHLEIDTKRAADSFLNYAVQKRFDSSIIGYLMWKKASVYQAPDETEAAFATPRSWEFADKHTKNDLITNDSHLLQIAIAGAVGSAIATDFMGFRQYYTELPDWAKIRRGEAEYHMPEGKEQLKYAVSSSLALELLDALSTHSKSNDMTRDVNELTTILRQLPSEMKIIVFKTLKRDTTIVTKFRDFPSLHKQVKEVLSKLKG